MLYHTTAVSFKTSFLTWPLLSLVLRNINFFQLFNMTITALFTLRPPLPAIKNYRSVFDSSKSNEKLYVIRSSAKNMDELIEWVAEFGKETNTGWNHRDSNPDGKQMVCR